MGHYDDDYAADEQQDEQFNELLRFARNEVEGPTLISPLPPKPYHTCKGCKYFSTSKACSGGLRHAPTYFKSCTHPSHPEVGEFGQTGNRSLTSNFRGEHSGREVTPKWCPLLGDANE